MALFSKRRLVAFLFIFILIVLIATFFLWVRLKRVPVSDLPKSDYNQIISLDSGSVLPDGYVNSEQRTGATSSLVRFQYTVLQVGGKVLRPPHLDGGQYYIEVTTDGSNQVPVVLGEEGDLTIMVFLQEGDLNGPSNHRILPLEEVLAYLTPSEMIILEFVTEFPSEYLDSAV